MNVALQFQRTVALIEQHGDSDRATQPPDSHDDALPSLSSAALSLHRGASRSAPPSTSPFTLVHLADGVAADSDTGSLYAALFAWGRAVVPARPPWSSPAAVRTALQQSWLALSAPDRLLFGVEMAFAVLRRVPALTATLSALTAHDQWAHDKMWPVLLRFVFDDDECAAEPAVIAFHMARIPALAVGPPVVAVAETALQRPLQVHVHSHGAPTVIVTGGAAERAQTEQSDANTVHLWFVPAQRVFKAMRKMAERSPAQPHDGVGKAKAIIKPASGSRPSVDLSPAAAAPVLQLASASSSPPTDSAAAAAAAAVLVPAPTLSLDRLAVTVPVDQLCDGVHLHLDEFRGGALTYPALVQQFAQRQPQVELPPSLEAMGFMDDGEPLQPQFHQLAALRWVLNRELASDGGGVLADEVGMGKSLSLLLLLRARPALSFIADGRKVPTLRSTLLVLTPPLLRNWMIEIQRFQRSVNEPSASSFRVAQLVMLHGRLHLVHITADATEAQLMDARADLKRQAKEARTNAKQALKLAGNNLKELEKMPKEQRRKRGLKRARSPSPDEEEDEEEEEKEKGEEGAESFDSDASGSSESPESDEHSDSVSVEDLTAPCSPLTALESAQLEVETAELCLEAAKAEEKRIEELPPIHVLVTRLADLADFDLLLITYDHLHDLDKKCHREKNTGMVRAIRPASVIAARARTAAAAAAAAASQSVPPQSVSAAAAAAGRQLARLDLDRASDQAMLDVFQATWLRQVMDEAHAQGAPDCDHAQALLRVRAAHKWMISATPFKVISRINNGNSDSKGSKASQAAYGARLNRYLQLVLSKAELVHLDGVHPESYWVPLIRQVYWRSRHSPSYPSLLPPCTHVIIKHALCPLTAYHYGRRKVGKDKPSFHNVPPPVKFHPKTGKPIKHRHRRNRREVHITGAAERGGGQGVEKRVSDRAMITFKRAVIIHPLIGSMDGAHLSNPQYVSTRSMMLRVMEQQHKEMVAAHKDMIDALHKATAPAPATVARSEARAAAGRSMQLISSTLSWVRMRMAAGRSEYCSTKFSTQGTELERLLMQRAPLDFPTGLLFHSLVVEVRNSVIGTTVIPMTETEELTLWAVLLSHAAVWHAADAERGTAVALQPASASVAPPSFPNLNSHASPAVFRDRAAVIVRQMISVMGRMEGATHADTLDAVILAVEHSRLLDQVARDGRAFRWLQAGLQDKAAVQRLPRAVARLVASRGATLITALAQWQAGLRRMLELIPPMIQLVETGGTTRWQRMMNLAAECELCSECNPRRRRAELNKKRRRGTDSGAAVQVEPQEQPPVCTLHEWKSVLTDVAGSVKIKQSSVWELLRPLLLNDGGTHPHADMVTFESAISLWHALSISVDRHLSVMKQWRLVRTQTLSCLHVPSASDSAAALSAFHQKVGVVQERVRDMQRWARNFIFQFQKEEGERCWSCHAHPRAIEEEQQASAGQSPSAAGSAVPSSGAAIASPVAPLVDAVPPPLPAYDDRMVDADPAADPSNPLSLLRSQRASMADVLPLPLLAHADASPEQKRSVLATMDQRVVILQCGCTAMHAACFREAYIDHAPGEAGLLCAVCKQKFTKHFVLSNALFRQLAAGAGRAPADSASLPESVPAAAAANNSVPTGTARLTLLLQHIKSKPPEDKILVFTNFKEALPLIHAFLKMRGVACTLGERDARSMSAFRLPDAGRVLLLPLVSGNAGLNLQVANHAIFLEPPESFDVNAQAIGRVVRMGQTKPVTITHFVAEGTHEIEQYLQATAADDTFVDTEACLASLPNVDPNPPVATQNAESFRRFWQQSVRTLPLTEKGATITRQQALDQAIDDARATVSDGRDSDQFVERVQRTAIPLRAWRRFQTSTHNAGPSDPPAAPSADAASPEAGAVAPHSPKAGPPGAALLPSAAPASHGQDPAAAAPAGDLALAQQLQLRMDHEHCLLLDEQTRLTTDISWLECVANDSARSSTEAIQRLAFAQGRAAALRGILAALQAADKPSPRLGPVTSAASRIDSSLSAALTVGQSLRGLRNDANVCYFNAVMQAYFGAAQMTHLEAGMALRRLFTAGAAAVHTSGARPLWKQWSTLFFALQPSSAASARASCDGLRDELNTSLRHLAFPLGMQHDAHELFTCFANCLVQEESQAVQARLRSRSQPLDAALERLMQGRLESQWSCRGGCTARGQLNPAPLSILDMSLAASAAGPTTISSCVDHFLATCEIRPPVRASCACTGPADLHTRFASLSPLLMVGLKRYATLPLKNSGNGSTQTVKNETAIDLEDGRLTLQTPVDTTTFVSTIAHHQYQLQAIVVHTGASPNSGHYVCYTRTPSSPSRWLLYDDQRVSLCAEAASPLRDESVRRQAYLLLYMRNEPCTADKGTASSAKQTIA